MARYLVKNRDRDNFNFTFTSVYLRNKLIPVITDSFFSRTTGV
jgi:hypothetical protein